MHYSYHNRIKQRIDNGEYVGKEVITNHPRISGNVLVLYFKTEPFERPVREHKFELYAELPNNIKPSND